MISLVAFSGTSMWVSRWGAYHRSRRGRPARSRSASWLEGYFIHSHRTWTGTRQSRRCRRRGIEAPSYFVGLACSEQLEFVADIKRHSSTMTLLVAWWGNSRWTLNQHHRIPSKPRGFRFSSWCSTACVIFLCTSFFIVWHLVNPPQCSSRAPQSSRRSCQTG